MPGGHQDTIGDALPRAAADLGGQLHNAHVEHGMRQPCAQYRAGELSDDVREPYFMVIGRPVSRRLAPLAVVHMG